MDSGIKRISPYKVFSMILLVILALLFAFPLYWIVTGAFKTRAAINATTPDWFPQEWVLDNFKTLFSRQTAPLWELGIPFSSHFTKDGNPIIFTAGPIVPAAIDDSDLYHGFYGGLCAGKKAFPRKNSAVFFDCVRDGAAQAGNPNPVDSGNVGVISL